MPGPGDARWPPAKRSRSQRATQKPGDNFAARRRQLRGRVRGYTWMVINHLGTCLVWCYAGLTVRCECLASGGANVNHGGKGGGGSPAQAQAPVEVTPIGGARLPDIRPANALSALHLRRSKQLWGLFDRAARGLRDSLPGMTPDKATASLKRLADVHSALVRSDRLAAGLDSANATTVRAGVLVVPAKSADPQTWAETARALLREADDALPGGGDGA